MPRRVRDPRNDAETVLGTEDASLLDIVDNVLSKGVVLSGDLTIALAQVDLIYAQLSVLLCAADRVLPHEDVDFAARHRARYKLRAARRRALVRRTPGKDVRR
jgi:hypothetical protein